MNLILTADNERLAMIPAIGEHVPESITLGYLCGNCEVLHHAEFARVSIHDDGYIYELKGIS